MTYHPTRHIARLAKQACEPDSPFTFKQRPFVFTATQSAKLAGLACVTDGKGMLLVRADRLDVQPEPLDTRSHARMAVAVAETVWDLAVKHATPDVPLDLTRVACRAVIRAQRQARQAAVRELLDTLGLKRRPTTGPRVHMFERAEDGTGVVCELARMPVDPQLVERWAPIGRGCRYRRVGTSKPGHKIRAGAGAAGLPPGVLFQRDGAAVYLAGLTLAEERAAEPRLDLDQAPELARTHCLCCARPTAECSADPCPALRVELGTLAAAQTAPPQNPLEWLARGGFGGAA